MPVHNHAHDTDHPTPPTTAPVPTPATPATPAHPSVAHRQRAAVHLRAAADRLDLAVASHEQHAHATAQEHAKEAAGHVAEAAAHVREADRLHAAHERTH